MERRQKRNSDTTITSGSISKLAGCIEHHVRLYGLDPDQAHDWTILSTPEPEQAQEHADEYESGRRRILISIELKGRPVELPNPWEDR